MPDRLAASKNPSNPQRERILRTALSLMSSHGLAGMSMRMLANECDLNVAALYHYFPSKAALFQSVIEEQNYKQRFEKVSPFDESDDDRSRIVALLCEVLSGALGEEPVWRLILGESVRGNDLAIQQANGLIEVIDVGIASWVRHHLPHCGDTDAIARLLLGQILATVLLWLLHTSNDEPDILATAETIADAVLSGRESLLG